MKTLHVRQPKGSYLCGQACLAKIRGIDLGAACKVMGHSRKTWTKEMVAALGPAAGADRMVLTRRDGSGLPPYCLVRSRWGVTTCAHYAVLREGLVYDPLLPKPVALQVWLRWLNKNGGRVTSYLPLVEALEPCGALFAS
jgi:hypothetical protein